MREKRERRGKRACAPCVCVLVFLSLSPSFFSASLSCCRAPAPRKPLSIVTGIEEEEGGAAAAAAASAAATGEAIEIVRLKKEREARAFPASHVLFFARAGALAKSLSRALQETRRERIRGGRSVVAKKRRERLKIFAKLLLRLCRGGVREKRRKTKKEKKNLSPTAPHFFFFDVSLHRFYFYKYKFSRSAETKKQHSSGSFAPLVRAGDAPQKERRRLVGRARLHLVVKSLAAAAGRAARVLGLLQSGRGPGFRAVGAEDLGARARAHGRPRDDDGRARNARDGVLLLLSLSLLFSSFA